MENLRISKEWLKVFLLLNEVQRRWFAAEKSIELGYGGVSEASKFTGLSRTTITQGQKELRKSKNLLSIQIRHKDAGRKTAADDKNLIKAIENILEETSAGDPMSRLKWTCKSTRTIAEDLRRYGFNISRMGVAIHIPYTSDRITESVQPTVSALAFNPHFAPRI